MLLLLSGRDKWKTSNIQASSRSTLFLVQYRLAYTMQRRSSHAVHLMAAKTPGPTSPREALSSYQLDFAVFSPVVCIVAVRPTHTRAKVLALLSGGAGAGLIEALTLFVMPHRPRGKKSLQGRFVTSQSNTSLTIEGPVTAVPFCSTSSLPPDQLPAILLC